MALTLFAFAAVTSAQAPIPLWENDAPNAAGKDALDIQFGAVNHSVVSVRTDLGNGNDTYDLKFATVDFEASVDVHTDLGAGANTHNIDIEAEE